MAGPVPSPSTTPETSRGHASRIDRLYYTRPAPLLRGRRWLMFLAFVAALGWAGWALTDKSHQIAPGAVVAAHATWENDCQACHVPLSPIREGGWQEKVFAGSAPHPAKCEKCHALASHSPRQVPAEVGSCSSCHVDHRGREADISRVADTTCTACHGDIGAHSIAAAGEPKPVLPSVTRFDADHHPPFQSLAADPGRVKFSHGRHMRAGLTLGAGNGADKVAWTYARLPAADRARYVPAGVSETDLVQLDCAACHQFASDIPPDVLLGDLRPVSALLAGRAPGAIALPVEFERHCSACHQLPADASASAETATAAETGVAATSVAPETSAASQLPHGLDAGAIRRFLESRAVAALDAPPGGAPPGERPFPVAHIPEPPRDATSLDELRAGVDARRLFVRGVCEKCHQVDPVTLAADGSLVAAISGDRAPEEGWFGVGPSRIKMVWLEKARFDHSAHRSWSCRECHAGAYPPAMPPADVLASSPLDHGQVLIAGKESCLGCHAPRQREGVSGREFGGARFDCVECHGYHGHGHLPPLPVAP